MTSAERPWEFRPVKLTQAEEALRTEVRAFLAEELGDARRASERAQGTYRPGLGMTSGYSPEFSRRLGARGWIGMAIPREYGGHGRSAVERHLVVEELLAAGAPVAAHWTADRQTAPTLLAFGTEVQKRRFLPAIARGECFFSIGMSERQAGSDLASVATTAHRAPDGRGWLLQGHKVWTGGAHLNHFFVVLCRTSPLGGDRHAGLSQLIVDLHSPGITVRPIRLLSGVHLFNEVLLDEVLVPDDMVLGEVGDGWRQVTSELAYERAGPDRFLSAFQVLQAACAERAGAGVEAESALGRLAVRLWAIRQLSLAVARAIDEGRTPAVEAAMVKDLGTSFEQETVEALRSLLDDDPDVASPSLFESLLAESIMVAPSYTIRGGTTEVLRVVASRGLIGT